MMHEFTYLRYLKQSNLDVEKRMLVAWRLTGRGSGGLSFNGYNVSVIQSK